MAPPSAKRRHGDVEGRREKKKIRVKKQKVYHSSSEDESDEELSAATGFIASDAPARIAEPIVPKTQTSEPKSILKQKPVTKASKRARGNKDERADKEDEDETLALNTAINSGAALGSEDEDSVEDISEGEGDDAHDDDLDAIDDDDYIGNGEDEDEVEEDESNDDLSDGESETSMTSSQAMRAKKKRNDPNAFATSISKILDTKLSTAKRGDPVLSRSKSAADANKALSNEKLEAKARAQIRAEKKHALDRGRVKDVLGLETEGIDTGVVVEQEKRLKKTAQRGVIKLFNAVRAAQVKAKQAMQEAKQHGVVGMRQREEKVNEMSKQGFLDLISSGGKTAPTIAAS